MMVKANMPVSNIIAKAEYLPYHQGILSLELNQVAHSSSYFASGGGYPVIVDVYDDGTIKELEIFTKVSSWQVNVELQAPSDSEAGNLILSENEHNYSPPTFWTAPDYSLLWIDFSSHSVKDVKHIQIADNLIVDLDQSGLILGWWLLNLPSDIRSWQPMQGLQVVELSDQAICSLKKMETSARAREDALKFALSNKLDSDQLRQIPILREALFCAKGQKEAALFALQSQGQAYRLQIAIQETEQEIQQATNHYSSLYRTSYLSGLKKALSMISSVTATRSISIPLRKPPFTPTPPYPTSAYLHTL